MIEDRPFAFGTAVSGENFTDREKETKRLSSNFKYGVNTILISPRRWGKTSLVKKTINMVKSEKLKIVYLDIFSCRTPADFYSKFAESIIKQTSSKSEEWLENIKKFLLKFNPRITMKPEPMSEFSFSFQFASGDENIEEILQLPEKIAKKKNCRIVVCIDEFQQIGEFKDSLTFQKELRSVWQHQSYTSYCLFGSKKHLMSELFENESYPFYKFGDILFLDKIPSDIWVKFIKDRFEDFNKKIDETLALHICELVENQSNYVQQLAWIVWVNTNENVTREIVEESFQELIQHNSSLFERITENLTTFQLNFLRAILDGIEDEFSRQEILTKYQLGTSSNITRIKDSLISKDIIDKTKGKIRIPDSVFREWLRQNLN